MNVNYFGLFGAFELRHKESRDGLAVEGLA